MNFIWISSFAADTAFIWLFFKRSAYTPQRQRKWLKPVLAALLITLYLNDSLMPIPYASVRVAVRAAIYFLWIFLAEGVPWRPSAYAAVFWTGIYTLFQNVVFGPRLYIFFSGQTDITSGARSSSRSSTSSSGSSTSASFPGSFPSRASREQRSSIYCSLPESAPCPYTQRIPAPA